MAFTLQTHSYGPVSRVTAIGALLSVFVLLDGSFLIVAGAPKGFPLVAAIGRCLIDQIAGIE